MKSVLKKVAGAAVSAVFVLVMMACANGTNSDEIAMPLVKITGATITASIGDLAEGPFKDASAESPVTVNTFYMAETELTYAKWNEVYTWAIAKARGDKKYTFANKGREGSDGTDGAAPTAGNTEPVTCVSWRDAVVWCNAASEKEGLAPVYYLEGTTDFTDTTKVLRYAEDYVDTDHPSGWGTAGNGTNVLELEGKAEKAVINTSANGYRLPTNAEWEFAARGGNPNSPVWSYKYAGTDSLSSNYGVFQTTGTANVKSKGDTGKNAAGLWDMNGNVSELCQDLNTTYGAYYIIRGGDWGIEGWLWASLDCVGTFMGPYHQFNTFGFRVVRSYNANPA